MIFLVIRLTSKQQQTFLTVCTSCLSSKSLKQYIVIIVHRRAIILCTGHGGEAIPSILQQFFFSFRFMMEDNRVVISSADSSDMPGGMQVSGTGAAKNKHLHKTILKITRVSEINFPRLIYKLRVILCTHNFQFAIMSLCTNSLPFRNKAGR